MKKIPSTLSIALILCQASIQAPRSANTLTPAEIRAGWTLIFDGVDKNANLRVGETGTTNSWTISAPDSAIASPNTGAMLFTKQSYSNFEFSADWKLNMTGNSGMFFRVNAAVGWICSGPEYAILDDVNGADRTSLGHLPGEITLPLKRTACNYDLYSTTQNGVVGAPYVAASVPYNVWSRGVYWANGNFIEHWLNGQKVVDYEIGAGDWLQRFQLSVWYNTYCTTTALRSTWARFTTGLIGFQDHGGGLLVWFRNLKVRPFTPGEVLISPMYTPNGGNFTGTVSVVLESGITGAEIRYTLDGSNPTATSPLYTGPLTLSATTTVTARTFRPRFTMSVASAATFTLNSTPILHGDLSPMPEAGFSQFGRDLLIRNGNGQSFVVTLFTPSGKEAAAVKIGPETREMAVGGLKAGLYLVKTSRGSWAQTRKFTIR